MSEKEDAHGGQDRGLNSPGKNLLTEHLRKAYDEHLDVRLVIATTDQPEVVERGEEAASIKKTFHIKENVVGKVALFDGDNFVIEFRQRHKALLSRQLFLPLQRLRAADEVALPCSEADSLAVSISLS